jgi:hypothetical protein
MGRAADEMSEFACALDKESEQADWPASSLRQPRLGLTTEWAIVRWLAVRGQAQY